MKNVLGQHKYKTLGKVIMACLALSHGNADAERSFSSNKRTVTPERVSLYKGSISAVHLVKDAIRRAPGGSATTVPITPALLRSSHQHMRDTNSIWKKKDEQWRSEVNRCLIRKSKSWRKRQSEKSRRLKKRKIEEKEEVSRKTKKTC